MGLEWFDGMGAGQVALLAVSLAIALGFEFVNGFHDTANAVATVIYTRTLRPWTAVVWSGLCNFGGVYLGGTLVAYSIVHLLPVDVLVTIGSGAGMAMVLALLIAAILWNLGTWYLGLPASSSHTLVGSILGVGMAYSALQGRFGAGVNWGQALEVGLSLLISPLVGFLGAAGLLWVLRRIVTDPDFDRPAEEGRRPPRWVRATLITTCTGVSLAHGSNDGQKGIGLIMLILIGLLPARYALNPAFGAEPMARAVRAIDAMDGVLDRQPEGAGPLRAELAEIRAALAGRTRLADLGPSERWRLRTAILRADDALGKRLERGAGALSEADRAVIGRVREEIGAATFYAPTWVRAAVALALGLGTMIGWKRIVVTVGEKIGKQHLTYAQGASAETVAMATIGLADFGGLPVSTTHVLSSGIAGTMAVSRAGLQMRTVRNIALAWVLTLPAAMALSAGLFLALLQVMG